jgi:hypothetical protein
MPVMVVFAAQVPGVLFPVLLLVAWDILPAL